MVQSCGCWYSIWGTGAEGVARNLELGHRRVVVHRLFTRFVIVSSSRTIVRRVAADAGRTALIELAAHIAEPLLELDNSPAQRAPHFGKPLAEKQYGNAHDDHKLHGP